MTRKDTRQKIDNKKALSIALAVLNGVQTNALLAVPLAAAAKDATRSDDAGVGMISLLNRGGQITNRLFFATAHAATNTITGSESNRQTVSGGDTLVVEPGGVITAPMGGVLMPGQGGTMINSGLIRCTSGDIGVYIDSGTANTATIAGGTVIGDPQAITVNGGTDNVVTVAGGLVTGGTTSMYVSGSNLTACGIGVSGGTGNTVNVNGGLVSGGDTGVYVSGGIGNTVTKAGSVTFSGGTVSGDLINGGTYGVYLSGGSTNAVSVSGGLVSGGDTGVYVSGGTGNAVTVAGSVTTSGGTVSGGLIGGGSCGIYLLSGSTNVVTVNDGWVFAGDAGVCVSGGSANTVAVNGGQISGGIQGILLGGIANTATVNGGAVVGGTQGILLGGNAGAATVNGGTVGGGTQGIVLGGSANMVAVNGGRIFGGMAPGILLGGSANTVAVNGGKVDGILYGVNLSGATGGTATVGGGLVWGGIAGFGIQSGTNSTVTVAGGLVSGSYGIYLSATTDGTVNVSGGLVSGDIAGMNVESGTNNTVNVAGGTVSGGTYGLYLSATTSGTVNVNGGLVTGGSSGICVSGGDHNTVNVAGGTVVKASISGATNALNVYGSGLVVDAAVDTGALLSLAGGGTVAYTADNNIANMTAAGGKVLLAYGGTKTVGRTLTIGNLSGSANFTVNTNLAAGTADLIKITNASSSTANTLTVAYDPGYASGLSVTGAATVAMVTSGSATFTAVASDYGAYSYTPTLSSTTDASGATAWKVTGLTTGGASETVRTAGVAIAGSALLWRAENNHLTKRLGELRNAAGEAGMWLRTYRGAAEIVNGGGRTTKQQYTALQGGWDQRIERKDGVAYAGWAVGCLEGASTYSRGTGEASSVSAAAYHSWLGQKGHFLDLIAKVGRQRNSYTSYLINTGNTKVDGSYQSWGASLSAEYGVRRPLARDWYVEPQAEVTFSRISGVSYTASDGTAINNDAVNSLVGRLGLAVGRQAGDIHYYGKVSLAREFFATAVITAASSGQTPVDLRQNLKENWLEFAFGLTGKLAPRTDGYLEITRTTGEKAKTPWQINVGVRWNF